MKKIVIICFVALSVCVNKIFVRRANGVSTKIDGIMQYIDGDEELVGFMAVDRFDESPSHPRNHLPLCHFVAFTIIASIATSQ